MQIGTQVTFFVVIVNFTLLKREMSNAKIEHTGIALRTAGTLRVRQVCAPLAIDEHTNHRMCNAQLIDVPAAVQERTDSYLYAKRVRLEQWRPAVGWGTIHHHIVEFYARPHPVPVECEVPEMNLASQSLTGLFLGGSQQIAVKPVAM